MNTHDRTQSFFGRLIRPLLIGVAVGILVCTLLLLLMAAVIQRVDVPLGAALPLAVGAAAVGAFAGGLTAALICVFLVPVMEKFALTKEEKQAATQ